MKVKNGDELYNHVFNNVSNNIDGITEVLVGDTYSPISIVINVDLKRLVTESIISELSKKGSINTDSYNREGYREGLAIDLEEINIRIEDKRMVIYTTRGEINED